MKRIRIITGIAITLCTCVPNVQANGCGYYGGCGGWWGFIPLAFGVGAAIGSAFSSHTTYVYSQPAYAYPPPVYSYTYSQPAYAYSAARPANTYTYSQPANIARTSSQPSAAAYVAKVPPVLTTPQPMAWTPGKGTGHWVRDPEPYAYAPPSKANTSIAAVSTTRNVVVANSPGSVPVYMVSR
jgi:hypothetical protein